MGGQGEDSSCHACPTLISACQPVSRLPTDRQQEMCIPHPFPVCRAISFFLASAGEDSSSGRHQIHFSYLSITECSQTALISPLNMLTLFKLHHKFMLVTLSTWRFWQEHHHEPIFAHKNPSVLSSPRSYTKQMKLSREALDRMPWRECAADVREKDKAGGGKRLPEGENDSERIRPGGRVASQEADTHPTSTKD